MLYHEICQQSSRSASYPFHAVLIAEITYRESVAMLAAGWSSMPCPVLFKSKFHSSSCVSFEKSASTAPALVPVAINGEETLSDQAKVAVRGISRNLTILTKCLQWKDRKLKGRHCSWIKIQSVPLPFLSHSCKHCIPRLIDLIPRVMVEAAVSRRREIQFRYRIMWPCQTQLE